MPRHSARRFLLEVIFLAGVAAALTIAELRPAVVIVLMILAWVVVALLEWTAWLDEPHYGRGLPPRYYVPQVALPPPHAVEQRAGAYQGTAAPFADERTFVASTTQWAEGAQDWPVLDSAVGEDIGIGLPPELEDETVVVVPLPPRLPGSDEADDSDEETTEDPIRGEHVAVEAAEALAASALVGREPVERRTVREPPAEPLVMPARVSGRAQHHIDPLAVSGRSRFGFRRRVDDSAAVGVPDGPPPDRVLPMRIAEENGGALG